jgi:hypothetical protein
VKYHDAVLEERKFYEDTPKENINFNEDDFMFKIGQRPKPVKDEQDPMKMFKKQKTLNTNDQEAMLEMIKFKQQLEK